MQANLAVSTATSFGNQTYTDTSNELARLTLHNALDTIIARTTVRQLATTMGYSLLDRVRISTAIFEIARDFVVYAGEGEIVISWREDDLLNKGLTFLCHDCGRNNPRLAALFQTDGQDNNNKLNFMGLRKLVDEFEYRKDPDNGNCVTLVKWARP